MVLKPTIKALLNAGVLAAFLPLTANAAGLGKLTVTSALGQPLRAEIELVAVTKGEAESITARIAPPEVFKEARIERLKALQNVQFSVEQRAGGEPYLKVTSSQPIEEPFLDMLIELNWPAGRLLREYTVLLDPPGYTQAVTIQPVDVPTEKPAAAAPQAPVAPPTEPAPAVTAKAAPAQPERAAPKAGDKAEAAEKTYGPVNKGETLAAIASHVKPEGYSLEQMLVALYQSNRQAFAGSNMNRLKTGQILRVPESSEIGSIGKAEAAHEIKAHAADWNAYRQKLAAAVTESAPAREGAAKQSASGKITTAVEDKAAPPKEPSRDVLKLSKGEVAAAKAAGGKEAQALQERIRTLQEEATAREKSIKDTNERIAALEKNIKDMQQLLAIKDKNLAELQKQAAATKGAPAQPEAPATKPEEPAKPAPAAEAQPAKPEAPKAEAPKPAPKPMAKPKPAAPPPPPPEPSLVDDMLANPIYLAGGGAAALLVGLLGYMALGHRRKKNLASFEDSIMTGGDLKVNTVLGSTAGAVVDTGDTSFLTDFSQAGMGTIDTNDVDPIAEAEVYMAYGRDAQAEEILKESLTKDPNRHEIHLKLLEIYAGRKNLLAFETLASELYAATGGQGDPIWAKAAEMGRAIDPNNPLYASAGAATSGKAGSGDTIMRGIPVATAAAIAAAGASAVAAQDIVPGLDETESAPEDAAPDLDFNLDQELTATMEPAAAESQPLLAEETASGLDFNMPETLAEQSAAEAAPEETEASAENALEFDLGSLFETPSAELAVAEIATPVAESAAPAEDAGLLPDFDAALLQTEAAPAAEAPAAAEEQAPVSEDLAMDFDIPEPTADELQPLVESEPIVVEPANTAADLDFDFEIEASPAPQAIEAPSLQAPELDLGGISLDIGEAPAHAADTVAVPSDADHQEAATKLDLARAYMEMGDREGAREILEEVRKEGSPQQQEEAGKLLASVD